jgi:integrase
VLAMRSTARRALACEREAAELEVQLDRLVRRLAPELLGQLGIGPVVAGQVISSWSHHGRIRSEAAFANLGGAAPIEASSGTVTRHRLNRSGDRQRNRALHTIVLVRMRQDCATQEYVQRRLVMNTAVDDEVIGRNPCRIKGAGVEPTQERPVIGVEAVLAMAHAVPERYRTLILLARFGSLRWGELMGLRKSDIDLNDATVSIERSVVEVGGGLVVKEPKTAAGVRTIALPRSLMPEIARHLDRFAEAGPDGRVFVGPYRVTPTRRSLRGSGAVRRRKSAMSFRLTFISMISGTPGTTTQRPRAPVHAS